MKLSSILQQSIHENSVRRVACWLCEDMKETLDMCLVRVRRLNRCGSEWLRLCLTKVTPLVAPTLEHMTTRADRSFDLLWGAKLRHKMLRKKL
mmetsp:Transcript_110010/g.173346  ORF Transcript_110010/g.173346 Transcript_110010/m.173346 type:complete len:93 (+) Transcript_110010:299-577(+)